jgi:general secretion pathway protein B
MSYILDALRRADSERERGAVPDVHAQQDVMEPMDTPPARSNTPMVVAVTVLSVALLGVLGWNWLGTPTPPAVVATVPPPPIPTQPAVPMATTPLEPSSPPPAMPSAAPPSTAPTAKTAEAPRATPRKAPAIEAARPASPSAATPMAPPPAPVKEEPRIYALEELPPNIRRELPQLVIGGASYSENPASRMLIINGQIFHERDKLSPGLSLERIALKSAVLDYKGYRYRVGY